MLKTNTFAKPSGFLVLALFVCLYMIGSGAAAEQEQNFFPLIDGGFIDLAEWKGRPYLVVNSASMCAFTRQYAGLQSLYDRYRNDGFKELAVPSGDFKQELDTDAEIKNLCELNYGIDMPMSTLLSVKVHNAHPFYQHLKANTGFAPRWNFNKVLIGPDGAVVGTWGDTTSPSSRLITSAIEMQLLQNK